MLPPPTRPRAFMGPWPRGRYKKTLLLVTIFLLNCIAKSRQSEAGKLYFTTLYEYRVFLCHKYPKA